MFALSEIPSHLKAFVAWTRLVFIAEALLHKETSMTLLTTLHKIVPSA
ncbi:hypothetical protein BLGI_1743 [Brevibacillus laterosporus GI-9]|nr:hypothetical protein BLGI_1743 [Brevibacillus laterosporus GI-9]